MYTYDMTRESLFANPTLGSVLMVETAAKRNSGELGKYQLWSRLPRKMTYQSFQRILAYLEESGKLLIAKDGKILWTYDPSAIARLRRSGVKLR
jgi:hypothetical protein